jgi:hypothetical protein
LGGRAKPFIAFSGTRLSPCNGMDRRLRAVIADRPFRLAPAINITT